MTINNRNTDTSLTGCVDPQKTNYDAILDELDKAKAERLEAILATMSPREADWASLNLQAAYAHRHYKCKVWMYAKGKNVHDAFCKLDDEVGTLMYNSYRYRMDYNLCTDIPPIELRAGDHVQKVFGFRFTFVPFNGYIEMIKVASYLAQLPVTVGVVLVTTDVFELLNPASDPFPVVFALPKISVPTIASIFPECTRQDQIQLFRDCLRNYEVCNEQVH